MIENHKSRANKKNNFTSFSLSTIGSNYIVIELMKLHSQVDIKWRFFLYFSPSILMKFLAFFNATRDFHTTPKPYFFSLCIK